MNQPVEARLSQHMPDLDSLETLLTIAATGSLSETARQRGVSQPAISTRMRRMEQLVGVALIERKTRGSTLTPQGILIAEWAKDVLAASRTLDVGIASLRGDQASRLRIAASLTIAEHLLPRWLVQFTSEHTNIAVRLAVINSADVADALLQGDADIGFIEGPQVPPSLQGRVVARDRLTVVVPPTHPWARRRRSLTGVELAGTRLVHREPTSGTRAAFAAAMRPYGELAPPLLELSTATAVCAAVAAGAGPAVLSNLAVRSDIAAGRLVEIPLADTDLARTLRAVWPRGQRPTGPARDLLAIARRPVS
jgi:DNA-binding transcriptional LysR family regulator